MDREKVLTLMLLGFGTLGILYYIGKKKALASPGAGGPAVNAGGASIARTVQSATAGVSGSIPNIIAAAAALTGTSAGAVASNLQLQSGGRPAQVDQSVADVSGTLVEPTQPTGLQGTQLVFNDTPTAPQLPGLGDFGPDVAANVSALDVGGLDYGTLYA